MIAVSFGICCVGFILLSLSMQRHYLQAWPHSSNFLRWTRRNRVAGYLCIVASGVLCFQQAGLWIGLVLWTSEWALAAFLQTLLLTYRPQHSVWLGSVGIALILVGLMA